ncbi:MAG: VOC family protein [Pseudomonadota bacterium]
MTSRLQPDTIPTISPVLFYPNLAGAASWLTAAFGFTERMADRVTLEDGTVVHAELALGNGMIILSTPYDGFRVPTAASIHHQCLYVSVDDARHHLRTALNAGARLVSDIRDTDYGARVYAVSDPVGYQWIFAETL